jgi:iron complex outermembrane receptor protein
MARFRTWLLAGFAVLAFTLPALAQSGTLSGRVTSSDGSRPIGGAAVTVTSGSGVEVARVTASGDGRYRVPGLSAGTYRVNVAAIGHEPRVFASVQVQAGGNTLDAVLEPGVARLEEITVVSAERSQVPEKATEAPASVFAITSTEIAERPVLSIADHLHSIPGVDVSQGGLVQSNIVGRGFNNIFSGALLMLIDYRYAAVPSLRVNVPTFFPSTNDDIYQAEFVLGPGAALYGPNASNGVLNIITKNFPIWAKTSTLAISSVYWLTKAILSAPNKASSKWKPAKQWLSYRAHMPEELPRSTCKRGQPLRLAKRC